MYESSFKGLWPLFKRFWKGRTGQTLEKPKKQQAGPKFVWRKPNKNELVLGWCNEITQDKKGRDIIVQQGIDQQDRSTHFYVIGQTGTGKTRFLQNLIIQDIMHERGFAVIDPHGDLIEDIKGWLLLRWPKSLTDLREKVVLIDPTHPKKTAVFNPLEKIKGVSSGRQAGRVVVAFEKIWDKSWGPRLEAIFRNSLIALCETGLTLAEIPVFLTNAVFRKKILDKIKNKEPECWRYFVDEFEPLSERTRREWIESTLNKVNAFLSINEVRHLVAGSKSTFNMREVIDKQKILLVNLNKGFLADASDLIGSLLMSVIQTAAFSRTDLPRSERTPFYLYIDEFQNFATKNFTEILSESRKYGLSLILAHQNISQLPRELRDSILSNCGMHIYFKLSRQDADLLVKEGFRISCQMVKDIKVGKTTTQTVYFTTQEEWEQYIQGLQDLDAREFFAINRRQGQALEFFSLNIQDPWQAAGAKTERAFKKAVDWHNIGAKHLRSRKEIEKEYKKRRKKLLAAQEPKTFKEPKKPQS